MGLRDRIRRVDNRIERRAERIRKERRKAERAVRRARGRKRHREELRRERDQVVERLEPLYEKQAANVEAGERDAELDDRIEELEATRLHLTRRIRTLGDRFRSARTYGRKLWKRVRWLVAKQGKDRKLLRELRRRDANDLGPEDFRPSMANGDPWEKLGPDERFFIVRLVHAGGYVTSTYEGYRGDGVHTYWSGHYAAEAVDGGHSTYGPMHSFYERELARGAHRYNECFGPGNRYVKNGVVYAGQFPGHQDHIHEDARS